MVSSSFLNGDGSSQLLIRVTLDGGLTFITVYDSSALIDLLDTIIPVVGATGAVYIEVTFAGTSTLILENEHLERIEGRIAVNDTIGDTIAYTGKSPVPAGYDGVAGRRLDFFNVDTGRNIAHCTTMANGFWTVLLPYGNYRVQMGRRTVINNLVVGTSYQIMSKRMTQIANQEERAWIATQFGDLEWAHLAVFDTFEDISKLLAGYNAADHIFYSRLWASNDRWMERIYVFMGVS
jgi:hypothetical protein